MTSNNDKSRTKLSISVNPEGLFTPVPKSTADLPTHGITVL